MTARQVSRPAPQSRTDLRAAGAAGAAGHLATTPGRTGREPVTPKRRTISLPPMPPSLPRSRRREGWGARIRVQAYPNKLRRRAPTRLIRAPAPGSVATRAKPAGGTLTPVPTARRRRTPLKEAGSRRSVDHTRIDRVTGGPAERTCGTVDRKIPACRTVRLGARRRADPAGEGQSALSGARGRAVSAREALATDIGEEDAKHHQKNRSRNSTPWNRSSIGVSRMLSTRPRRAPPVGCTGR